MLAQINKSIGKMVLCYLNGRHSIPLMIPAVQGNPDVEFYFHSRTFAGVDFMATPMSECPNAHFVGDFDELKFKLNLFGAFITTDANAARSHVYSLKLVSMFKALGIPVLELQHGMFQIGLHYYDVPSGMSFWGDSLPSKSFADRVLAFYQPIRRTPPSTVIGYPPYSGEPSGGGGGEYLLVLTNLHWPTYTTDEKMAFLDAVAALVESRPELPVVWKMHHAETPPASKINQMVGEVLGRHPDAKRRIRFAHLDPEFKDKTASELIAGAKCAVSTVSTVLLDCEIYRRPTAVYACASNDCLVKMIKSADFFGDGSSLAALFERGLRPIQSGKLLAYDNAAFRAALDAIYKPSPITQEKFLSLLLSQTFRDDFIARNTAAKDSTIATLRKSDEAKGAVIEGMKSQLADAVRENGSVLAERDAARDELALVTGERAALEVKFQDVLRENGKIASERDAARDELATVKEERAALETKIQDVVRENGKIACERDAARDELANVKGERDTLQKEREKADCENGRLDSELAGSLALCAEKDAAIGEYMSRIDGLSRDVSSLTAMQDALAAERDELRRQLAASQARANALKGERDAVAGNLAASQARANALKGERDALAGKLTTTKSTLDNATRRLDVSRREVRQLREQQESRSWRKRFHRLIKGILPYGVVCTWKRMAYGISEDQPLFAYPGFFKRCWRIVKFLLPYFVVAFFKRLRYGSLSTP